VTFVDSFTIPDPDGQFEREPLVARFQAGFFDFRVVGVHIKPEHAYDELAALAEVAETIADSTEGDVILLGDFNADCSYLNESDAIHPLRAARYHWVIADSAETAVKSGCTYDRIVMLGGTFGREYVPNSGQVTGTTRSWGSRTRISWRGCRITSRCSPSFGSPVPTTTGLPARSHGRSVPRGSS